VGCTQRDLGRIGGREEVKYLWNDVNFVSRAPLGPNGKEIISLPLTSVQNMTCSIPPALPTKYLKTGALSTS
jgi:hypothetical protein